MVPVTFYKIKKKIFFYVGILTLEIIYIEHKECSHRWLRSASNFSLHNLICPTNSWNIPRLKHKLENQCQEYNLQFFLQSATYVWSSYTEFNSFHDAPHLPPDSEQQWGLKTCLRLRTRDSDMAWSVTLSTVDPSGLPWNIKPVKKGIWLSSPVSARLTMDFYKQQNN